MLLLLFLPLISPFLVSGLSFNDAAGTVSLTISQGDLLGKRIDAYDNRTGYGFLGIPYAAPPVGPLRFAKPVAADGWEGVRNVTTKGVACAAKAELTYRSPEGGPMAEDCLHVYVYSSKNCLLKGGCAIMCVLQGGRYNFESPVNFIDEVIVHNFASDGQDVVVVIPAHRLENFGFLNIAPGMNTSATPNAAMWDLLLALQWTRNNAHFFGGDPEKITIMGHSSGAATADVISTSAHFDGLFRGLVVMSGAETAYDAGIKTNSAASWLTANILGCATEDSDRSDVDTVEQVIECLRAKTWEEIVQANRELTYHPEEYRGPHADGPGGIFPLSPRLLSRTRKPVPMMIGTTTAEFHEGEYALSADGAANLTRVAELCEAFGYGTAYIRPDVMTKRCLDYYMQGQNVVSFEQDTLYFYPTLVAARDMARKGNKVYLYSFAYADVGDAFRSYRQLDKDERPGHSEDYVYILGMHRGNFTSRDYEIEKIFSGMVLNFVKTGYPDPGVGQPAWKPFRKLDNRYYEINFDEKLRMPGMKKDYQAGAVTLWADDAEKYAGGIVPTDEFPPHFDRFYPLNIVQYYASHHLNQSALPDKTFETWDESYRIWTRFIEERRLQFQHGQKSVRSIAAEQPIVVVVDDEEHSNLRILLVMCVSIFLLFLIVRSIDKERQGYQRL